VGSRGGRVLPRLACTASAGTDGEPRWYAHLGQETDVHLEAFSPSFTTEQKVAILKRHMVDKVPVSDLCNELGLQPSVFYTRQRYYPQSNGKIERWHKTIRGDAIRPGQPKPLDEAREFVARWVKHYNAIRLHSAIGYISREKS
jgi:hypothetical protein